MKKLMLISTAALLLSGCVNTELSNAGKAYNPQTDARIRLYGQNGRYTEMEVKQNGKTEKVNVGGGWGQSFGSMLYLKGNESLGMPDSETSKKPSQFNNFGSSTFFKEFVIPAGAEITLKSEIVTPDNTYTDYAKGIKYTQLGYSCSGKKLTFTPQAGKDYEALPAASTAQCNLTLVELK